MELVERAKSIRLLLMDCDGVLTDGRLYFSARGEELKVFNVRDGEGIVAWHKAGYASGIISGRNSGGIIQVRAGELGIKYVRTGSHDKVKDLDEIISEEGVSLGEVSYIGDDVGDLDVLKRVGLAIAVADAVDEVKTVAHYVTEANGGNGSVREAVELLLRSRTTTKSPA